MFIFSRSTSCGLNKSIYTEEFIIVQRKPERERERETGNSVPLVVFAKASIIITIAHTYGYRNLFKLLTLSIKLQCVTCPIMLVEDICACIFGSDLIYDFKNKIEQTCIKGGIRAIQRPEHDLGCNDLSRTFQKPQLASFWQVLHGQAPLIFFSENVKMQLHTSHISYVYVCVATISL